MAKPILILRAASDAPPMAEALERMGYEPILNPLIQHIARDEAQAELDAITGADALILTSAHALDNLTLPQWVQALPCYCVGQRTAAAALKAGLDDCEIFPSASALAERLKTADISEPLYLRGEHITQPFDGAHELVTYSAETTATLTAEARGMLNDHSDIAVAFTSARLVHLFCLLLEENNLDHLKENIIALCMSDAIAVAASAYGYIKSYGADSNDLESLYNIVAQYY